MTSGGFYLGAEPADLNDKWEMRALEAEDVEVGLEKADITVAEVSIAWIPR
ncbi:MAG TPA: hypothetical protein VGC47_06615 [Acidimicrobiia bacterium]|jgi:hypothetical protein